MVSRAGGLYRNWLLGPPSDGGPNTAAHPKLRHGILVVCRLVVVRSASALQSSPFLAPEHHRPQFFRGEFYKNIFMSV